MLPNVQYPKWSLSSLLIYSLYTCQNTQPRHAALPNPQPIVETRQEHCTRKCLSYTCGCCCSDLYLPNPVPRPTLEQKVATACQRCQLCAEISYGVSVMYALGYFLGTRFYVYQQWQTWANFLTSWCEQFWQNTTSLSPPPKEILLNNLLEYDGEVNKTEL